MGNTAASRDRYVVVKVTGEEQATEVKGTFLKRTIPFFREIQAWGTVRLYRACSGSTCRTSRGPMNLPSK